HVGRWAWNSAGGHWERRTRHVVDKRWKGVVAARLQGHAPGSNHGTPLFHVSAVGGFREQSRDLAPVQRRLRFDGYGDCVPRTTRLRALPYERRSRETKHVAGVGRDGREVVGNEEHGFQSWSGD